MLVLTPASLASVAPGPVSASQFSIGPTPSWVEPISPPATGALPPDARGGTYVALLDFQENQTLSPAESYTHIVVLVLNEQGVGNASQIAVSFDPSYQQLVLHTARVQRAGETQDRLQLSAVKLIQREERLEYQIYDGHLTALLLLEDVRVGDAVEYSYTLRGENPALAGHFSLLFSVALDQPVARFEQRLIWKPDQPLVIRRLGDVSEPQVEKFKDRWTYAWSFTDVRAIEVEEGLPLGFDPFPGIQLSSWASWEEVAAWGTQLFAVDTKPSTALQAHIEAIRDTSMTEMNRALRAIRFVQDEIRYLGVVLGASSHRPNDPNVVMKRRFGDCKDKALLLVTMLRALGIQADPALVSTGRRGEIAKLAPAQLMFDHSIVRIELGGHSYWVDPTLQGQRGGSLSLLSVPEYGYALVLRPGVTELTAVERSPQAQPQMVVEKTYDGADFDGPVRLRIETTYHGAAAEAIRLDLASGSPATLAKRFLAFYEPWHPGIESVDSLAVHDDEQRNVVKVIEQYSIPGFWKPLEDQERYSADLEPVELSSLLPTPPKANRKMAFAVGLPAHMEVISHLHMAQEWKPNPESSIIENDGFRFAVRSFGEGRVLHLTHKLERRQTSLPSEAAGAYAQDLAKAKEALDFTVLSGLAITASGFQVNWIIAFLVIAVLAGSTLGARKIYRLQPALTSAGLAPTSAATQAGFLLKTEFGTASEGYAGQPEPVSATPFAASAPAQEALPIGGWLRLLGIGVFLNPIIVLVTGFPSFRILERDFWILSVRLHGSTNYALASVLVFEISANAALVVLYVLLIVMFLQRRRLFPRLWIAAMAASIVVILLDFAAAATISESDIVVEPGDVPRFVRMVVVTGVWGTYLMKSRRVRETFVL